MEHSKQQNGPDIIDTCYLLSIKRGDGLAVIPYSQSQNCYLLALLASVFFHAKVLYLLFVSELYARTTFGLLDILTYLVYVL